MKKLYRKRFFINDKDEQTFRQMIRMCQSDYPAQTFVGVDSELRPCVFAGFAGADGSDFDFWHFSTWRVAVKAFTELEKILDEQLQADMRCAEMDGLPF